MDKPLMCLLGFRSVVALPDTPVVGKVEHVQTRLRFSVYGSKFSSGSEGVAMGSRELRARNLEEFTGNGGDRLGSCGGFSTGTLEGSGKGFGFGSHESSSEKEKRSELASAANAEGKGAVSSVAEGGRKLEGGKEQSVKMQLGAALDMVYDIPDNDSRMGTRGDSSCDMVQGEWSDVDEAPIPVS